MKTTYTIVEQGFRSFLYPENHPHHKFSLLKGKRNKQFSLQEALSIPNLPKETKEQIQNLLINMKPILTEKWEHTIYNYMRNCYSPDGINQNVSDCVVDKDNTLPVENHLAVMYIKSWFPDYIPNIYLIHNNGDKGQWNTSKSETNEKENVAVIEKEECRCNEIYDCCDCGGHDCGCGYCFSCNACEDCLKDDE